jgi:hypothetical protein
MLDKKSETITPDQIARLLRDAGAPDPEDSVTANQQLASILNLMKRFPTSEETAKLRPEAKRLNSAVASLWRKLPHFIEFWEMTETLPKLPQGVRDKVHNFRELERILNVAFPKNLKVNRKEKSCWWQVEPDLFEYHARTPWHEKALYLFAWYQSHVQRTCGISRDSAVTSFIKAALELSGGGCHSLDAIEKALTRALKAAAQECGLSDQEI